MSSFNNREEINRIYQQISPRADALYRFVVSYHNYMNMMRDYGTGEVISMVEVHILTLIEDHPGITVSELTRIWGTTKGAISQTVKKLEGKGLITRTKNETNGRISHLFASDTGEQLSLAHKSFDNRDILETTHALLQSCTSKEIDTFYKVIGEYSKLF